MNPRQRRGALLLALTALCAVGVFLGVMSYVSNISTQVGPTGPVLKLTRDVAALEPIEPDMVEEVQVPRRWIPSTAVTTTDATLGLVAGTDYTAGSILQEGMLVPRPGIQPGYREVAIVVDAETGVAGKVGSGDRVDIIATTEATDTEPARSELWVSNALVLDVGLAQDVEGNDAGGDFGVSRGVPVTFALTSEDALRLAYVESFSVKLRLALRGAGDEQELPENERVFPAVTIPEEG